MSRWCTRLARELEVEFEEEELQETLNDVSKVTGSSVRGRYCSRDLRQLNDTIKLHEGCVCPNIMAKINPDYKP